MASIYTDESREARYDKLRKKRDRCEKVFSVCMWLSLFIGITTFGIGTVYGLISGVFLGEMMPLIISLFASASCALAIYAVYAKNWKLTLAALLITAVLIPLQVSEVVCAVVLIPVLIANVLWERLSKEEGFPEFRITQQEFDERRKSMERQTKKRALALGVRVAATDQSSEMGDLLDAGSDTPIMPGDLHAYHERGRQTSVVETAPVLQQGNMDSLEDI